MPTKKKPAKKPAKKQVKSPRPKQAAPKEEDLMLKMDSIPTGKLSKEAGVQPFLFGEADQILNALETELSEWKSTYERLDSGMERLVKKMEAAEERISGLSLAINATRRHAPMTDDPAPPTKESEDSKILGEKALIWEKIIRPEPPITERGGPKEKKMKDKEFRTPDIMATLDKVVKLGALLQPDFQDAKVIVANIIGPKNTVQSSITADLVSCPPCYTLLLTDYKGAAVYYHNMIMCEGRIQSIFRNNNEGFDIIRKSDKASKDPY